MSAFEHLIARIGKRFGETFCFSFEVAHQYDELNKFKLEGNTAKARETKANIDALWADERERNAANRVDRDFMRSESRLLKLTAEERERLCMLWEADWEMIRSLVDYLFGYGLRPRD